MLTLWQFEPFFPLIIRGYGFNLNADPYTVEIGYNRLPPGLTQRFQRDIYILHYIASGKGTFLGKPFEKGDGYLVVPNEVDIVTSDEQDPCEYFWIMFHGRRSRDLLQSCNLEPHNGIFHISQAEKCVEIIKNALFTQYNNSVEEANVLQSVLFQLIAIHASNALTDSMNSRTMAKSIAQYIEDNYYKPLRISDVAKSFYITRSYMYTLFKREMGISPKEYLIEQRIEKAKAFLNSREHRMTIKEISYAVGFTDPLYFSNVFREKTGQTPTEYRKLKGTSNLSH
ncbi:MAG: AraC family transcriptional regulator [Clostridia bacterium]|nr:AraC family transcriptional regulator [Clostridia bacterium]